MELVTRRSIVAAGQLLSKDPGADHGNEEKVGTKPRRSVDAQAGPGLRDLHLQMIRDTL
jgi:hypothetical protein